MELIFLLFFLVFLQTELSHNLQQLSEKARSTTEFIQRLKGMSDKVTVSIFFFINLPLTPSPHHRCRCHCHHPTHRLRRHREKECYK